MISVIVAVYNEERIVSELVRRLEAVFVAYGGDYEILFVDDGSHDATPHSIEQSHRKNGRIKLLQFSRNFGQVFALRAGLAHARGDTMVMMDGDLQDLPEEIPRLIKKLNEGYDVVYAKREQRKDTLFRKIGTFLFTKCLRFFVPKNELPPGGEIMLSGVFRALRREVVDALNRLPEHSIYIQGLIFWTGFRQTSISVAHGPRFAGTSRYRLSWFIRYAFEAIISFSPYPLRKAMIIGFAIAGISFLLGFWYLLAWILWEARVVGFTSIVLIVLFLGGIQLFLIGVIGEYIGRMYIETKRRPLYLIKKKLL